MARVAPRTPPTDNDIRQQQTRAPSASVVHPVASSALAPLWPLRVYWLAIVTMHLLVGAYFLLYAATYRYLASNPQTVASYLLGTVQESTERFHTPVQGVSLMIMAAHAIVVLKAVVCSVWYRDLVFSPPPGSRWFMAFGSEDDGLLRSFSIKRLKSPRISIAWATIKRTMPSELELLQVTNTVEVALQAYQANKISRLVAKPWINRLMVTAIVLNCWTIPIVNFWYRRKSSSRLRNLNDVRAETLAKLLLDALVDTVYGIAVPSAIFYPYATTIDLSTGLFPPNPDFFVVWRTDMWATANQFLVSSYVDLASKMMPGVTLLFGLGSMQEITTKHRRELTSGAVKLVAPNSRVASTNSFVRNTIGSIEWGRFVNVLLVCAGFVILWFHVHTSIVAYLTRDNGCLIEYRPWGYRQHICASYKLDCAEKRIVGSLAEVDALLAPMQPLHLDVLFLIHCPSLEIPPRIQTLSTLKTMFVHNSTIAGWDENAGVARALNPHFGALMVTLSNMTTIPKGVRMRNSPFISVIFCGTNLTRLPDDLGQAWDHASTFFFELSPGLKELPASVSEWQVSALSLSSNGIEFIPEGTRFGDSVSALSLGFNPVQSIPSSIMEQPSLTFIDARGTDISELPAPTLIAQGSSSGGGGGMTPPKVVQAAGSPMCERMLQPPVPGEIGGGSEPQTIVTCEDPLTFRTWYPLSQSLIYFAMPSE